MSFLNLIFQMLRAIIFNERFYKRKREKIER